MNQKTFFRIIHFALSAYAHNETSNDTVEKLDFHKKLNRNLLIYLCAKSAFLQFFYSLNVELRGCALLHRSNVGLAVLFTMRLHDFW